MPASLYGMIASAPCSVDDLVEPRGDLGERLVPRDLLESALALGADAAQRVQHPVGLYTRSRNLLTFGHSSPWLYGWSGLPRICTATGVGVRLSIDGDLPAARVGAVVVARAVDDARPSLDATRTRGGVRPRDSSRRVFR